MDECEDTRRILSDIRDLERQHLEEYRRISQEVLNLQRNAVERQTLIGGVYKRVVVFGGIMAVSLLDLLVYLLVKWWGPLFGR
jgi:type IV secretory pathway TrbD component